MLESTFLISELYRYIISRIPNTVEAWKEKIIDSQKKILNKDADIANI